MTMQKQEKPLLTQYLQEKIINIEKILERMGTSTPLSLNAYHMLSAQLETLQVILDRVVCGDVILDEDVQVCRQDLSLLASIDYHKKSLEICRRLIRDGKLTSAGVIINLLENNINRLQVTKGGKN